MLTDNADIVHSLTTIRDYIRWAASQFSEAELVYGHGTLTALDDAAALVLRVLHQPYDLVDFYLESTLTLVEREKLISIIKMRISTRKPTAYLTQDARFASLSFYVDERVLVPRSPIAELILEQFTPWVDAEQVYRVLDLCTGSACIAIACAYAFPEAQVDAVDLSEAALEVAAINVEKHQLEGQVQLWHSDLFEALPEERYDIIVSNPPYVSIEEWQELSPEFHNEPKMGLVAEQEGIQLALRILIDAAEYLSDQGILVVEVGSSAQTLQDTLPNVPFFWLDFERGGDGVFLLTAEQVNQFHSLFKAALI